jgi:hypothetical protein
MSEKELGQALLQLDSQKLAGVTDAREQTWRILERDRRRVWWLTALTITLWGAALLMVLWMLVGLALLMPFEAHLIQDAREFNRLTPEQRAEAQIKARIMFQMITVGITCSVGLSCLAILATVLLNAASRRATLRQINASLLEISQQLKELKQAGAEPKGSA